ncbi:PilZ domain-containing protein [Sphingorhabdus sp.]|uniref:PilZ domain-containing protein n=1 Tax=Sphingorhabdus sp. TaxID=1902408 RepID=UPI0039199CB2
MVKLTAQKRSPKRTASFLKAKLKSESLTQEVCVRDVSVNGALLDVAEPLRVFEIVTLICGDTQVNGIVAWSDQGRVGMEFSELLTSKLLVDALNSKIKVSAPKNYQPEMS